MTTDDATPPDSPDAAPLGDREPRPRGIVCPRCSLRMLASTTRAAGRGLKVRYYRCPSCRTRARTEEKMVRVFDPEPAPVE